MSNPMKIRPVERTRTNRETWRIQHSLFAVLRTRLKVIFPSEIRSYL